MESLLTPDKGLIVWTVITFVLLLVVLSRFGWKPLLQSLEERERGIRKAVDDAAAARLEAERLRAQLEKDLSESQSRVQAILKEAQADAQKVREQIVKDAQSESQRLTEQTRRQLEEEKTRLMRELRAEVAGLSLAVAEKLLRKTMTAKDQENLIQEILKDLDKEKARQN
jgi:F-type H+-transporting ATPase subunit b